MDSLERSPKILLLHDGELSDVAAALEPLGLEFTDRSGNLDAGDRSSSWDLLIGSSQRMLASATGFDEAPRLRIAVLDGNSRTLRSMLRRAGSHLVIRRPVHPAALRLLILHGLYRGPEKRADRRVSVGASVRIRTFLLRRPAILAELSESGCRLLVPDHQQLALDQRVWIQIPAAVCEGEPLSLRGHVVRIAQAESGASPVALEFDRLRPVQRRRLAELIDLHADGPAMLHEPGTPTPVAVSPPELVDAPSDDGEELESERRGGPRRSMSRRIIALGEHAARVLIGRDLSRHGMRVDPTPGVKVGDGLQIALHVRAGGRPLVVRTQVTRDDGEDGIVLQFVDIDDAAQTVIDEMVDSLPMIDDLEGRESESAVFISELLEQSREE